jgi:hypothetical protein
MKTEDLITVLAAGTPAVIPGAVARRFAKALGCGLMGALLLMFLVFGVRADIAQAATLPMFWAKLLVPSIGALIALPLAMRLSRPGRRPGPAPIMLAALLLMAWGGAGAALLEAPPAERAAMIFGDTWKTCTLNITLLALPLFGAGMWVVKGLAPTRPAWAGGSCGLLAGAAAASVYALHCPEMAAPFLAIWYVLGIATPAVLGALLGPRLLRW